MPLAPGAATAARYLTPDANAEVTAGCARIREVGENVITPAMHQIEAEDPSRHLAGLEYRLKGENRLKEKVSDELDARRELTAAQALSSIPDAVRFTFRYDQERYTSGVRADLERLNAAGFELAKPLRNSWSSDQYKGINTQWRDPETGQRFEVQFHTSASFEAKQLSHDAYERLRNPQTSELELDELRDYQRLVCDKIPVPHGASEIDDLRGRNTMAEKVTYYALIDDYSSRERPGGVVRRVEHDEGQRDEAFSKDLVWKRTPLLYAAERGDTMNDFVPITEEEAMQIVDRIRREAAPAG